MTFCITLIAVGIFPFHLWFYYYRSFLSYGYFGERFVNIVYFFKESIIPFMKYSYFFIDFIFWLLLLFTSFSLAGSPFWNAVKCMVTLLVYDMILNAGTLSSTVPSWGKVSWYPIDLICSVFIFMQF